MPPQTHRTPLHRGIAATLFILVCAAGFSAATATAADQPASARLVSLDNGDISCYLNIRTTAGNQSLPGDFELCPGGTKDATRLVGKLVEYTTKRSKVMAASCGGAENCKKTDVVDLVVTVKPAGTTTGATQPPVPVRIPAPGR